MSGAAVSRQSPQVPKQHPQMPPLAYQIFGCFSHFTNWPRGRRGGALSRGLARSRRIARVEVNRRIRTSRLRPLRPLEKGSGWLAAERVRRSSASSSITLRTLRRIRLVNTPIRIHLIRLNGVRPQGFSRVWSTVYSAAPARERFHVRWFRNGNTTYPQYVSHTALGCSPRTVLLRTARLFQSTFFPTTCECWRQDVGRVMPRARTSLSRPPSSKAATCSSLWLRDRPARSSACSSAMPRC
jgi:hypothetical protein